MSPAASLFVFFIEFQPFELLSPCQPREVQTSARGMWPRGSQTVAVALAHADNLLFFQPVRAGREWNYLVMAQGNPFFHPPARALEKLGETRTLELFFKRAMASGAFGRFFVGALHLLILNAHGRHLVADRVGAARNRNFTPFQWNEINLDLEKVPSSQLWNRIQNETTDSNSPVARAMWWHSLDYFERLWQSLKFQNGDVHSLRQSVRDLIGSQANAWNTTVDEWTLLFSIQTRLPRLEIAPMLFQKRGNASWEMPDELRRKIENIFAWHGPIRTQAREWEEIARREWLDHSGGTSSWNLEVSVPRMSFHEQIEASLRLKKLFG